MPPLAVVGIGCLFPRAADFATFWANIKNGVDAIGEVPPTHWRPADFFDADPKAPDRVYAARGGFLDPVAFAPAEYGIAPNNLEATDTSQLLGLVAAQQALADAGLEKIAKTDVKKSRDRVATILGVTGTLELVVPLGARLGHPLWRRALKDAGVADSVADDVVRRIGGSYVGWQENSFPGLLGNVVAGRIANRFDLGGTNCVVDAACASSLGAIHLASLELAAGRADAVLTGGVDTFNDIFMFMCFSKTPALSPTGDARPFDAGGDGTILGEGLGLIVLKRLADAERDGDRIYAVLKGIGSSSDGKGNAVYAPKASGQVEALRRAYTDSGISPATVELVEGHGTGTKVGDATEVAALKQVYQEAGAGPASCALGSIKSQIGHTKAAAGAAGIIKAVAALYHKVLPPTLKVRQPLEILQPGQTPFYVNAKARPWVANPGHPRRAAVSAFGFGGSNFHCVLEEYQAAKQAVDWDGDVQIVALGADTPEALLAQINAWPADMPWETLRIRAGQSRRKFPSSPCRLLLVVQREGNTLAKAMAGAKTLLAGFGERSFARTPDGIFFGRGPIAGKLGVLFPGQGAQYVGMGRDLACLFPEMLETLAEANQIVGGTKRLSDAIYPPAAFDDATRSQQEADLRATDVAQPALGAVSLGALRVLIRFGVRPEAAMGHSYGELVALHAAGRFTSDDLFRLSKCRGQLMAEAGQGPDTGTMLAVQAGPAVLEKLLADEKLDLTLANKNAPRQTVLSGKKSEIDRAEESCRRMGLRATRLEVAAAFHSPLVQAAQKPFLAAISDTHLMPGRMPVVANSTADFYPDDFNVSRELLAGQLARPVEFVAGIERLYHEGVRTFLEVGPGARLSGLVGAILAGKDHETVAVDAAGGRRTGVWDLACCLAALAARGYALRLDAWDDGALRDEPPARTGMTVPICGANYVKPKPDRPATPVSMETPRPRSAEKPTPAPTPAPAPIANRSTPTKMTAPTKQSSDPLPAPVDSGALAQALQVTRENLVALQRMQEQTAQLHRQFLEGQETAQRTVHLLVEQQLRLWQSGLGLATALPALPAIQALQSVLPPPMPGPLPPRAVQTSPPTPRAPLPPAPTAPPIAIPPAPVRMQSGTARVQKILLDVIAEKTGYPTEMLDLNMALDADLGIDSIKRVEILSALQERLPEAPVVKPEHLGTLHNLQQIVAFLADSSQSEPASPSIALSDVSRDVQRSAASDDSASQVQKILLEVIAEKTGYPTEMLGLDMALDSDLGIDSIKRVEILSALQERLPEAPVVKPEHLGTLHNLRQIAAFLADTPHLQVSPDTQRSATTINSNGAPPGAPPPMPEASGLERSVPVAVPFVRRQPRPADRLTPGNSVWIAAEDTEIAGRIAQALESRGLIVRIISFADLETALPVVDLSGLILLAAVAGMTDNQLRSALLGARNQANILQQMEGALVTVSRLDGSFGLRDLDSGREPVDGGLAGLAKTARHEWPTVNCRAFDLAADFVDLNRAVEMLVDEMFLDGPAEVGISDSGLVAIESASRPSQPSSTGLPLKPGDVVVVTGGARGVTAEVALALAQACRPTLVILGRNIAPSPEPDWLISLAGEAVIKRELSQRANGSANLKKIGEEYQRIAAQREVRQTLSRLATAGARVVYRSVDVRDAGAIAEILGDIRRQFGPVRGLIHGAGVLADARIDGKTSEQFDLVYGTKVAGLRSLLSAIQPEELRALVLFSSTTARMGRVGQVDYAMANEVLNKMAGQLARRWPACRVLSINWGPWDGGMVTPGLKKLFNSEGVGLIPVEAGGRFLVNELATVDRDVEVVVLGTAPTTPATPVEMVATQALPAAFERVIDLEECPILASHVIDGRVVLPMALILEWFGQAALHQNPGMSVVGVDGLRVLNGVKLQDNRPATVRISASKVVGRGGELIASVEMRGLTASGKDILHARAEVLLANQLPPAPVPIALPNLPGYGRSVASAYAEVLFHGAQLQAIRLIEGCGPEGISAEVESAPAPSDWLRSPLRQKWVTDPLALDAAFQLMILWSSDQCGGPSLPCHIGSYRQYVRSFPGEGVRIACRVTRGTSTQALADIDFLDRQGHLLARIEGYECTIDPGLSRAFGRRQAGVIQ